MAAVVDAKSVRSWGPEVDVVEVVYDFSKDAGATGALDMVTVKDACVVRAAYLEVLTTCTSGGSATYEVGISGATAGLIAQTAVASLTAGAVIEGAFDVGYKLAADAVVIQTIATAALTAGKIKLRLELAKFN